VLGEEGESGLEIREIDGVEGQIYGIQIGEVFIWERL